MTKARAGPHILVEGDAGLTWHLWERCETKPIVLSPDPLSSALQTAQMNGRNAGYVASHLRTIWPLQIIDVRVKQKPDSGRVNDLIKALGGMRRRFGLASGERLVTAMVGSHTSFYGATVLGDVGLGGDIDSLHQSFAEGMRSRRTLIGLFGLALEGIPEIELAWLAELFPELGPAGRSAPGDGGYSGLAAQARDDILKIEWDHKMPVGLKRPILPQIYTRMTASEDWRQLEVDDPSRRLASTTNALIGQFVRARERQPGLKGVLVKVLAEDIAEHSPVDPPVIGGKTLQLATEAGLSAILLDKRRGIIRPCVVEPLHPPVFAV